MPSVLLVGCGKMGGAMAQRWQEKKICSKLVIVDPASSGIASVKDVPSTFKPQVIVFAVKPQSLPDMIQDYKIYADQGALFISIAAGKTVSFFEQVLGEKAKIVRSMPNLPASIGQGITAAYANAPVVMQDKAWAETLLKAVGDVVWVEKENLIDPVTALSGSGPAYVFLLIETLTKAGIHIGLDPAMAERLARQTVIGSAALAAENADISAATLRENVTSRGGTTQAALDILMATPGVQDLFDRALTAARQRAEELSK